MWNLLDRFGRPSLSRHLQRRALELNQHGLQLLSHCGDAAAMGPAEARQLVMAVAAADACWRVFRGTLPGCPEEPHWRAVKANLQEQARLLRPPQPLAEALPGAEPTPRTTCDAPPLSARRRRDLQGTLLAQSRWLGVLVERPAPPETELKTQMVRIYRKARQALRKDPTRARARRRLARLVALAELMDAGTGPMRRGRLATIAGAGRRLLGLQAEYGGLTELNSAALSRRRTRLVKRRQGEIVNAMEREVARHFAQRPRQFADGLVWELFCCLAEQPEGRSAAAHG